MSIAFPCATGLLALGTGLAGCATPPTASGPPAPVSDTVLGSLLLDTVEVDEIMGTASMRAHPLVTSMGDHRAMLPNLSCLGVWQQDEASTYDPSHWKSLRQQMSRTPDTDQWEHLVVQSVVSYRTADEAREFLAESADRWSKCTHHDVNIQVNNQVLPAWRSGELTRTDDRLAMPYTRDDGGRMRSCQHVLQAAANVIIDVVACAPPAAPTTAPMVKAADVADRIEAGMPR
ncbi:sensor domain-containing protein [Mycobacterium sp. GA-1285]|uniref:sensor domain-containing protein n=1 Tax=Mycobacterium sp. GA-1285 TaxID=1772282 RepID=UPI000A8A584E|nr:sensor domain-containing protein [Mycobacterium sp. GA-1285]